MEYKDKLRQALLDAGFAKEVLDLYLDDYASDAEVGEDEDWTSMPIADRVYDFKLYIETMMG